MSNFLDLDPEDSAESESIVEKAALREKLAKVPIAPAPTRLHSEVSDKLAAGRGFSSREAAATKVVGGRRSVRGVPAEETRQLSIRMPVSLYNDFLAYANEEHLTYNEAIRALLDK